VKFIRFDNSSAFGYCMHMMHVCIAIYLFKLIYVLIIIIRYIFILKIRFNGKCIYLIYLMHCC